MTVSSLVRGLSALVPVILAAVVGAGAEMDHYMAFLTVVSVVSALSANPFANIVSREIAAANARYGTGPETEPRGQKKQASKSNKAAYGKAAKRARKWATRIGNLTFALYLPISGIAAIALSHQSVSPLKLWALLLVGGPCVWAAARIAVEQALLQARGRPYLALGCSSLFSVMCLAGATLLLIPGMREDVGMYLCATAVSVGAVLELLITKKFVVKNQEKQWAARQAEKQVLQSTAVSLNTALDSEQADLSLSALPPPMIEDPLVAAISKRDQLPWKDFFVLTGASAGALLSGFFDQGLMSHLGQGVQATFGLASRIPSFLTLSIFSAGSILAAMLLANKPAYSSNQLRIRIFELFLLMLAFSGIVAVALWWQALPLTRLIYQHGEFEGADSLRVAGALPFAILAYLPYPASAVLMRCAAVQAGPRVLLFSSAVFLMAKAGIGLLGYTAWGLGAIAVSSLVAYTLQCAILWYAILRQAPGGVVRPY